MGCSGAVTEHDRKLTELVAAARSAMEHAHAPYSRFAVGAAVRLTDGSVVVGCNFENASYGLSLCAETVALACVNAQGRFADVEEIAVVGGAMDGSGEALVTPCGRCRQIINEAEQMAGREIAIHCATPSGDRIAHYRITDLLPDAFGPADLGITPIRKS